MQPAHTGPCTKPESTILINPFQTGTCLIPQMDKLFCILPVQTGIDFFLLKKNCMWCTMRVKQRRQDDVSSCLLINCAKLSVA